MKKFSPNFYVSHGPHWAAQGRPNPWTPHPGHGGQLRRCPRVLENTSTCNMQYIVHRDSCYGKNGVVAWSKIAIFASCGRYIFRNFIYETKIVMSEYVVPNRFSSTLKQMILNDFALNTACFR